MKTAIRLSLSSLTLLLFWFIPCCAQQQEDYVQEFDITKEYILLFDDLNLQLNKNHIDSLGIELRIGDILQFTDEIYQYDKRLWQKVKVVSFNKYKYETNERRTRYLNRVSSVIGFLPVHKGIKYWFLESSKKEKRENEIVENLQGHSFAFHTEFQLTKPALTAYSIKDSTIDYESRSLKYEFIPQPVFQEDRFIYLKPRRMNGEIYHNFHVLFMKCKRGNDVEKIRLEFGYDILFIRHEDFVSLFKQVDSPPIYNSSYNLSCKYLVLRPVFEKFFFSDDISNELYPTFNLYPGDEVVIDKIDMNENNLEINGKVTHIDNNSCGNVYSRSPFIYPNDYIKQFQRRLIIFHTISKNIESTFKSLQ